MIHCIVLYCTVLYCIVSDTCIVVRHGVTIIDNTNSNSNKIYREKSIPMIVQHSVIMADFIKQRHIIVIILISPYLLKDHVYFR